MVEAKNCTAVDIKDEPRTREGSYDTFGRASERKAPRSHRGGFTTSSSSMPNQSTVETPGAS
jgi:hypothetical protein